MSWVQNGRKENIYDPDLELEWEAKMNYKMVKILFLFLNLPFDMKVLVNHQVTIFSQNILPYFASAALKFPLWKRPAWEAVLGARRGQRLASPFLSVLTSNCVPWSRRVLLRSRCAYVILFWLQSICRIFPLKKSLIQEASHGVWMVVICAWSEHFQVFGYHQSVARLWSTARVMKT